MNKELIERQLEWELSNYERALTRIAEITIDATTRVTTSKRTTSHDAHNISAYAAELSLLAGRIEMLEGLLLTL